MHSFTKDNQGMVTVFVTLVLIPSVLFIGLMIDLARFKLNMQIVGTMNQATGMSLISKYDGLLKDTYGLFGLAPEALTSTDGNYAGAIVYPGMAQFGNTVSTSGDELNLFGKRLQGRTDWEAAKTSSLRDGVHLQNQIGDYMKFRAAASFYKEGSNVTEALENLNKIGAYSKAINSKVKLDKKIAEINKDLSELYKQMVSNDRFDRNFEFAQDESRLTDDSRRSVVTTVTEAAETISDKLDEIESLEDDIESLENSATEEDDNSDEINDAEADISDCNEDIKNAAEDADSAIAAFSNNMSSYENNLEKMDKGIGAIKGKIDEVRQLIVTHKSDLADASEDMRKTMEEELKDYELILDMDPSVLASLITNNKAICQQLTDHFEGFTYDGQSFGDITSSSSLSKDTGARYNSPEANWKQVKTEARELFDTLSRWYKDAPTSVDKEKKGQQEQAQDNLAKANEERAKEEPKGAKKIPDNVAGLLSITDGQNIEIDMSDANNMTDDISTDMSDASDRGALETEGILGTSGDQNILMQGLHKILLVEYDLGMFSCATTGKDGKKDSSGKPIVAEAETISGIPLSTKLNFLYGSELEYLYCGDTSAMTNRLAASGTILGMLYIRDFAYSYRDSRLNKEINTVGTAIGGGNPLTVIVAKLALRGTATGFESGSEINYLMKGNPIPIIKSEWKMSISDILSGNVLKEGVGKGTIDMDYEGFMRVLLLLFQNSNTLTQRTADLIELNITNYKDGCNGDETKMKGLTYRLKDRYTAVWVTSTYKLSFIFNTLAVVGIDENKLADTQWNMYNIIGY